MKTIVNPNIYLTQIRKEDKPSLLKHINDKDIYNNTLKIPFPYTGKDADEWISFVEFSKQETGVLKHWTIKNKNNELIGGVGFHSKYGFHSHKDEIGYWLGKPFWNKGIMTDVIKKICSIGFNNFNLIRIEATVLKIITPLKESLKKPDLCSRARCKNFIIRIESL